MNKPNGVVELTDIQEGWLELLYAPPSPFCRSETHWDLGGVRAYVHGTRSMRVLEKKGLVAVDGARSDAAVRVTDAGRAHLIQLHGACGNCSGDGWECGKAACRADHATGRCRNAQTCSGCDGRGY